MAAPAKPTRGELAILGVLWTHGECTVREIHDRLAPAQRTGYTTTLKQIQIMTNKGLVTRTARGRFHVYRAKGLEGTIQKRLIRDLVDLAFAGSSGRLVMQALSTQQASPEELREIRRLLDEQDTQDARPTKKSS
jgi:predicted transcriptional regulator